MSVPLDRLYNFLHDLCNHDIIIYRWAPHGSKKLKDLMPLIDQPSVSHPQWVNAMTTQTAIFHDQEPLNFDLYSDSDINALHRDISNSRFLGQTEHFKNVFSQMHPYRIVTANPLTVYDKFILCHSEKNSNELLKFENSEFIGAYYWSHALISRDWFRYAEHDPSLTASHRYKFDFLIYNRAWAGTREYRLKFFELLLENQVTGYCKTSFSALDNDIHYSQHKFYNSAFELKINNLESHFVKNTTTSCFSADYDSQDYNECGIEVVLETLFDDQRNHLTEKSLRPIACKKAFILASTPFSLEYLRSYGFKTFDGLIDETYDTIVDPVERLQAIIKEMVRISNLSTVDKETLWEKLNVIVDYNHRLFFSNDFHNMIVSEFNTNIKSAMEKLEEHSSGKYWNMWFSNNEMLQQSQNLDKIELIDTWLKKPVNE